MIAAEQWRTKGFFLIAMTLTICLAGTALEERLELKWRILVLSSVTVVRCIRDGSVEDILRCQMALFCVKCVLQDTRGAVNTQPSSVFATAMDFIFINCHLPFCILMVGLMVLFFFLLIILTMVLIATFATALAMGVSCQQLRLKV